LLNKIKKPIKKMDFIVSYHLYNQIKKKEKQESLLKKPIKEEDPEEKSVNYTCPKCGQDPYFCQCKNNIKSMYKNFDPEKDNY
jgi:predicted RNA-binding Zn-ribbon protein involved in translation (DUF1610 family)